MSLFVRIQEPVQLKKALLITKMSALNNIKRYEESKKDKKEIKEKGLAINEIILNIPSKIDEIKGLLPETDIKKMTFEKGMIKCEICGRRFKTEQGLKIHQANVHGLKKTSSSEGRSKSQIDKISKELEELERELKKL